MLSQSRIADELQILLGIADSTQGQLVSLSRTFRINEAGKKHSHQATGTWLSFAIAALAVVPGIMAAKDGSACFAFIALIIAVFFVVRGVRCHHDLGALAQQIETESPKRSRLLEQLVEVESELNEHLAAVKLK